MFKISLPSPVFELSDEEQTILSYIAKEPLNLFQISTKTEKHTSMRLGRSSVKNKIYGSEKHSGLIKSGYLIEKNGKKHPRNNQEKIFYLTFKGLITVLSHGIKFENTFFYKKFFHFIHHYIDNKQLLKLIRDFIIYQIYYFLIWHSTRKQQLTIIPSFYAYYRQFFAKTEWYEKLDVIPLSHLTNKELSQLKESIIEYVAILNALTELKKNKLPNVKKRLFIHSLIMDNSPDYSFDEEIKFDHRKDFHESKIPLLKFIRTWYDYIEHLQLEQPEHQKYIEKYWNNPLPPEEQNVFNFEEEIKQKSKDKTKKILSKI